MNRPARKTESLSYPANPLAAMRELQELDPVIPAKKPEENKENQGVSTNEALQVALITSSEVGSATSSETEDKPELETKERLETAARSKRRKDAKEEIPKDGINQNPMKIALIEMLGKPYGPNYDKGPFTVTTVKIPTEVWERLGWLSSLTGQAKQEIIADALKDCFDKVAKGK